MTNPNIPPQLPQDTAPCLTRDEIKRPGILVALSILAGVHIVLNVGLIFIGTAKKDPVTIVGILVSIAFYIAILIGLLQMREWARIMFIWLAYCGLVFSLGILAPLEIPTLIIAHWPSLRKATKKASLPKTYTYHESVQKNQKEV